MLLNAGKGGEEGKGLEIGLGIEMAFGQCDFAQGGQAVEFFAGGSEGAEAGQILLRLSSFCVAVNDAPSARSAMISTSRYSVVGDSDTGYCSPVADAPLAHC